MIFDVTCYSPAAARGAECACLLSLLVLVLTTGCSTLVTPPAQPENPRSVFLLEHGQHASLVLPGKERGIVRYSYGDWKYYSLGEKGIATGLTALLSNTLAGLGRRELPAAPTPETVQLAVLVPIVSMHELKVEARAIETLRAELDGIYRTNIGSRIYNADIDLEFVHHPVPYSAEHNSNKVVAGWLEVLGCEVRNPAFLPNWKVKR
jgi:hypothetical protein